MGRGKVMELVGYVEAVFAPVYVIALAYIYIPNTRERNSL